MRSLLLRPFGLVEGKEWNAMEKRMVIKRTGEIAEFDSNRIRNAIQKAGRATNAELASEKLDELVAGIAAEIEERFQEKNPHVEEIQDLVEKHLMQHQLFEVSKAYIIYRATRQKIREETKAKTIEKSLAGQLTVKKRDGSLETFELKKVKDSLLRASKGFPEISIDLIAKEVVKNIYDGVTTEEIEKAMIMAVASFIEKNPAYSFAAGRLFLQKLYKEAIGRSTKNDALGISYREAFVQGIQKGVSSGQLDKRLLEFDFDQLAYGLRLERDQLLQFIGIQTLYERYFLKTENKRLELPQGFWMRVAMGLAINEKDKNQKALEFYELISSLRYVPSTPTLFHAGMTHAQLSSCYLTTVMDDLDHIFKSIADNARLSKWSGGLGNDWSNIRATGAWIKSTNVESQGVIPFLKIANDVTVAINRSGKRRGATCAYLETWHLDIEDFLDLRRNTGDERRRTHDMNTANWIPDLFMKRMQQDELWTLFSPEEVPELHHTYGKKFEKKYVECEEKARKGGLRKYKIVSAKQLWRKMVTRLFETGHPWMTFKDPCNIRSPQDHAGIVHSSNLCTEITLNTSADETAVCNLGSINLEKHVLNGKLDTVLLAKTARMAMRMLDNVIDINFYPTIEAQNSNLRHRPVGLGIMGLQDALFRLDIPFDSPTAIQFCDELMEIVSYYAILTSSELAKERGAYETFKGSKWERGIFPIDTIALLEEERGQKIEVNREEKLDWGPVKQHVKQFGMRNSNCMAIAPTATIANIAGCFPSIEPIYKNIYVKANMSGEFTVVNSYIVEDLKKLGLWNQEMLEQLKYHDGNVQLIAGLPEATKEKYREAFEIDPDQLIDMAAVRGKWIDQSQSLNIFLQGSSGTKISETYQYAWKKGLKTTYYLRGMAASQIEKSTLDANKFGFTQKREYKTMENSNPIQAMPPAIEREEIQTMENNSSETATQTITQTAATTMQPKVCLLDDPTCEACQ